MPSALDTFRAQQEAADHLQARLIAISGLLAQFRQQVGALAVNDELKGILQQEEKWLERAQRTVAEVRLWREQEMFRFWRLACCDDGRSPLPSPWHRPGPPARATRGSRGRMLRNCQSCAHECTSRISSNTES